MNDEEVGARFSELARQIKSSLDSMAYAAPEMQAGWRARIWQDIGECCADIQKATKEQNAALVAGLRGLVDAYKDFTEWNWIEPDGIEGDRAYTALVGSVTKAQTLLATLDEED